MRGEAHGGIAGSLTNLILTPLQLSILCKIARFSTESGVWKLRKANFDALCEQFRSVILLYLSDDDSRDEHFFSLFQVFCTKSAI
jgi:hypothetical protein